MLDAFLFFAAEAAARSTSNHTAFYIAGGAARALGRAGLASSGSAATRTGRPARAPPAASWASPAVLVVAACATAVVTA